MFFYDHNMDSHYYNSYCDHSNYYLSFDQGDCDNNVDKMMILYDMI